MKNLGGLTAEWHLRSKADQIKLVHQKMNLIMIGIEKKKKDVCCKDLCRQIVKENDPSGIGALNISPDHERIPENEG